MLAASFIGLTHYLSTSFLIKKLNLHAINYPPLHSSYLNHDYPIFDLINLNLNANVFV